MDRSLTVPLDLTTPAARARTSLPRAFLDVHHATDVKRHPLQLGENRIGRAGLLQVVAVPLPGGSISRVHAIIECLKDGTCFVEDQKSTNKTYFSHDPLKGPESYSEILPGRRYQLNDDCGLRFGSVYATFHFNTDHGQEADDMDVEDAAGFEPQRTATPLFTNKADGELETDAQRVVTPVLSSLSASPAAGDAAADDDATDVEEEAPPAAAAKEDAAEDDGDEDVPVVTKRQGRLNSAVSVSSVASVPETSAVDPTLVAGDDGDVDVLPPAPTPADSSAPPDPPRVPSSQGAVATEEAEAEVGAPLRRRSKASSVAAAKPDPSATADTGDVPPDAEAAEEADDSPSPSKELSTVAKRGSRTSSLTKPAVAAEVAATPSAPAADNAEAEEETTSSHKPSAPAKRAAPKRSSSKVAVGDDGEDSKTPQRPATRASHPTPSPAKKAKPTPKSESPKKTARSARLEALTGGAGDSGDAPSAHWYFKKDLRLKPENENAWLTYSVGDTQELEKAYQAKKNSLRLNDKYSISFAEMIQYRNDDHHKQRPVKREE